MALRRDILSRIPFPAYSPPSALRIVTPFFPLREFFSQKTLSPARIPNSGGCSWYAVKKTDATMPRKFDSDATPGDKLLRLFRRLLADGKRHFLSDLAAELRCSPQTASRLLRNIAGIVGDGLEEGFDRRRRWYRLRADSSLCLGRDFAELRCLSLGRKLAAPLLPEPVLRRMDGTIVQLALLMAEPGYGGEIANRFAFFSKGRIDYDPHMDTIRALLKAAEERRVCLVRYRAPGWTEEKEYRFAARQLAAMSGSLYAFGVDVDEAMIVLRSTHRAVHRITAVTLTEVRHHLDIPEAEAGTFGLPWHEPRSFRIRFTPGRAADYVRERIWADSQEMEDAPDGGLILAITTRSEPELAAWVRSFGPDAAFLPRNGSPDGPRDESRDESRDGPRDESRNGPQDGPISEEARP
jgi:hypothetical protein